MEVLGGFTGMTLALDVRSTFTQNGMRKVTYDISRERLYSTYNFERAPGEYVDAYVALSDLTFESDRG